MTLKPAFLSFNLVFFLLPGPAAAQISADHWLGGAIRIGPSISACDNTSNTEGALRWNGTEKTFEMCDGTEWKKIIASGSKGTPTIPSAEAGYFVLTHDSWSGNLGGIDGANDKCLSDLTTHDWMNKSDAVARNILTAGKVRAFLCTGTCNNVAPNVTYYFAVSGAPTLGGASFTANSSGSGPDNAQNWSGLNYFSPGMDFWTGRSTSTTERWSVSGLSSRCAEWVNGTSSLNGGTGTSDSGVERRWQFQAPGCDQLRRLVCIVQP